MNSVDRREIWLDCLIIAILVSLIFLLIVSNRFMIWFASEIPDVKYRTLSAAGIIFIVVYILCALILKRREQSSQQRYHNLAKLYNHDDGSVFPHDLDETMDDICSYISTGLWCGKRDWFDTITLRYVW